MVTLSPEAGQGSEPGLLLKWHPVGAPSAALAVPRAGETMGRVRAAAPGEREGCAARLEAPGRTKRCSDSTGRRTREADEVRSNVRFPKGVCTGTHTTCNSISLLFCPLRELPGILASARAGSPSRAWPFSPAETSAQRCWHLPPWESAERGTHRCCSHLSPPLQRQGLWHTPAAGQGHIPPLHLAILNHSSRCLHMASCTPTTAFPTKFLAAPAHISAPKRKTSSGQVESSARRRQRCLCTAYLRLAFKQLCFRRKSCQPSSPNLISSPSQTRCRWHTLPGSCPGWPRFAAVLQPPHAVRLRFHPHRRGRAARRSVRQPGSSPVGCRIRAVSLSQAGSEPPPSPPLDSGGDPGSVTTPCTPQQSSSPQNISLGWICKHWPNIQSSERGITRPGTAGHLHSHCSHRSSWFTLAEPRPQNTSGWEYRELRRRW